MLKQLTATNTNMTLVVIQAKEIPEVDVRNMLYDITNELNDMKYNCIYVPDKLCTCHKWFKENPYFYDDELDVYGFCVEPNSFTAQNIADIISKWKKEYKIDKVMYMAYNYCDTFYMPYSHKIRGFADVLHTTKKHFLDNKVMVNVI